MQVTTDQLSLSEAVNRLSDKERPRRDDLASHNNASSESWDLNTSFSEASDLALVGWQEKAEELWRYVKALAPKTDTGIAERFDVSGGAVDVGRFLSGEPECMLTQTVTPLSAVKIMVNISASAGIDARLLFNRGIALAAIIHSLQSSGRSVSLSVGESVQSSSYTQDIHNTVIELQRFGEYINPGRLAFWVAHPAALRRCIFRYNEQQDGEILRRMGFYDDGGGYGQPRDFDPSIVPQEAVALPHLEYSNRYRYETPERAIEHLVEEFNKQGIPINLSEG
jgi:hypothetical protein